MDVALVEVRLVGVVEGRECFCPSRVSEGTFLRQYEWAEDISLCPTFGREDQNLISLWVGVVVLESGVRCRGWKAKRFVVSRKVKAEVSIQGVTAFQKSYRQCRSGDAIAEPIPEPPTAL